MRCSIRWPLEVSSTLLMRAMSSSFILSRKAEQGFDVIVRGALWLRRNSKLGPVSRSRLLFAETDLVPHLGLHDSMTGVPSGCGIAARILRQDQQQPLQTGDSACFKISLRNSPGRASRDEFIPEFCLRTAIETGPNSAIFWSRYLSILFHDDGWRPDFGAAWVFWDF